MRQTGEPNTLLIVGSGMVFAVALVAGILALEAYFYGAEDEENGRKVVAMAPEELAQARAQQAEQIHAYRWIDRPKGVVGIPIEAAMELVVREGAGPAVPSAAPAGPKSAAPGSMAAPASSSHPAGPAPAASKAN